MPRFATLLAAVVCLGCCASAHRIGLAPARLAAINQHTDEVETSEEMLGGAPPTGKEKILLSSQPLTESHLGDVIEATKKMLSLSGDTEARIIFICTAHVYDEPSSKDVNAYAREVTGGVLTRRRAECQSSATRMQRVYRLKQPPVVFDFSDPSFQEKEYLKALQEFQVLYVIGGNTYALSYWMHRRGHMDLIRDRVRKGDLTFLSSSAGSIFAGVNIKAVLFKQMDSPTLWYSGPIHGSKESTLKAEWAKSPFHIDTDVEGLNLVPGLVVFPHYSSGWELQARWLGPADTLLLADGHCVAYWPEGKSGHGAVGPPEKISTDRTKWGVPWIEERD